jgi:hypothetical protein
MKVVKKNFYELKIFSFYGDIYLILMLSIRIIM